MKFFVSRFIRIISSMLTILLIKYSANGNESLGKFTYWYIIILFAGTFVKFNNQAFVLRYKDRLDTYMSSLFYNQLVFYGLSLIVLFFVLPINMFFIATLFLLMFLFDPWEYIYMVTDRYHKMNGSIIVVSILSIIVKLVVFQLKLSYEYFLFLSSFDFSTGFVLYFVFTKKERINIVINKTQIVEVLVFLFPFLLNSLLVFITPRISHFVIKKYFDFSELGVYSFSYRFYEGLFIFQVILNSILISKYHENFEKINFTGKVSKFLKIWFGVAILTTLLVVANFSWLKTVVPVLIPLEKEVTIFMLLLPGVCFSFFGIIMAIFCSIHGYSREILYINCIALIISIVLNVLLLPSYGLYAAAFITVFNQLFSSVLLWFVFPRTRPAMFKLFRSVFKISQWSI